MGDYSHPQADVAFLFLYGILTRLHDFWIFAYPPTKACLSCLLFPQLSSRLARFHFSCVCCQRRGEDDDVCMLSSFSLCTIQERFGDEQRKTCTMLYCDDDDDKHRVSRRCGGIIPSMISNEKREMWWLLTNSTTVFHSHASLMTLKI